MGSFQGLIDLRERFEDALQVFGGDSGAVVLDMHGRQAVAGRGGQTNAGVVAGVFRGVVQEVIEDLFEADRIAFDDLAKKLIAALERL